MTKQEKQLLLIDLCAREPYHPRINVFNQGYEGFKDGEFDTNLWLDHIDAFRFARIEVLPYLRPMSTMTEEEKQKMSDGSALAIEPALNNITGYCPETMAYNAFNIDFCLSRHLDYRGLIEKGLALEAPEGMYKID